MKRIIIALLALVLCTASGAPAPEKQKLKIHVNPRIQIGMVGDNICFTLTYNGWRPELAIFEVVDQDARGNMEPSYRDIYKGQRYSRLCVSYTPEYYIARQRNYRIQKESLGIELEYGLPMTGQLPPIDGASEWDGVVEMEVRIRDPKEGDFQKSFTKEQLEEEFLGAEGKIYAKIKLRVALFCPQCTI